VGFLVFFGWVFLGGFFNANPGTKEENPKHTSGDHNQGHVSVAPLTRINRPRTSVSTGSNRGENGKFVTLGESGAMLGSLASILAGPSLKENISIFQVKQKKELHI
jgi:hypothetical protein